MEKNIITYIKAQYFCDIGRGLIVLKEQFVECRQAPWTD